MWSLQSWIGKCPPIGKDMCFLQFQIGDLGRARICDLDSCEGWVFHSCFRVPYDVFKQIVENIKNVLRWILEGS